MDVPGKQPGAWSAMASGLWVVIRRQRVLWWLFLVNFILGMIAVLPVRQTLGNLLDHSLASRPLADHFDLSAFIEVLSSPQFSFGIFRSLSLFTAVIFALVVLLAEPGVIQEFRHGAGVNTPARRQSAGEFFGTCGAFLLRMVRLLLWSIVPLALFAVLLAAAGPIIAIVGEASSSEIAGFYTALLVGFILFLVLAAVRLWINMAEIDLLASGERKTRRTLFGAARKLTFSNFGKLYTIQLVTAIAVLAVTILGLTIWIKFVPPAAVGTAFIVSETTLLLLLACRLWQKASLVVWYERWVSMQPEPVEEPLPIILQAEPITVAADSPVTVPATPEATPESAPAHPAPPEGDVPGPP
jgi:hypothetical protein